MRALSLPRLCVLLPLLLTGCVTGVGNFSSTPAPPAAPLAARLTGSVFGGQQPVSGSSIQLYAVGITGSKSAATPLLVNPVSTSAAGNFTITGDWNCTSNTAAYGVDPLLYIVASGGNPGLGGSVSNPALVIMAALGPCSGQSASTFIAMNEITTTAAIYALAPFMADSAHIGAQGAKPAGIVNAFAMAAVLANTSTGSTPGAAVPANVTVPTSAIITLADMIAACINSNGTDSNCTSLFANATPPGGTAPFDVAGVLLSVVRNPGNNVAALFNNIPATPPYQPVLSAPPNDWTLALSISGGGLAAPAGVAIDAGGNAWIANAGGSSVTELGPTGIALTGSSGYAASNNIYGPQGIAVDRSGNVWLADTLLNSVVELTLSAGTIQSSSSYTAGGLSGPIGLAIDSQNDVWIVNFAGGSVTELNSAGAAIGAGPLTANGSLVSPAAVAIDPAGNAWITDNSAAIVAEYSPTQALISGSGYTDSGILAPAGLAIDAGGRAWVADNGTSAVSLFAPRGAALLNPPTIGGGLSLPAAVAIDGAGTVWVANSQAAGSLTQLTSSGATVAATGFGTLNQPLGIAIDASGNIWTANSGDSTISIFIGLATPVTTPLAARAGP